MVSFCLGINILFFISINSSIVILFFSFEYININGSESWKILKDAFSIILYILS